MLTENVDHSTDDILFNTRKPVNEPPKKKKKDVAVIWKHEGRKRNFSIWSTLAVTSIHTIAIAATEQFWQT